MSRSVIGLFSLVLVTALAARLSTVKLDNIALDDILRQDRLYKQYFDCLTNKGKCTNDGLKLKEAIPYAMKTGCQKCTEKQRQGAEKVLQYVIKNRKGDFDQLERLYDPSRVYRKSLATAAKRSRSRS